MGPRLRSPFVLYVETEKCGVVELSPGRDDPALFLPGCHIDRVTRGFDRLVIYAILAVSMDTARAADGQLVDLKPLRSHPPDLPFIGRKRSRFFPNFPVGLHLALHAAHDIHADPVLEHRRERATHPARVGVGEIGRGDQRVRGVRAALVVSPSRALPLARCAVRLREARPGPTIAVGPKLLVRCRVRCPWRWRRSASRPEPFRVRR